MALAQSNMMELGTKAPDFTLFDTVSKKQISLSQLKSNTATVVAFICNHCPFVHHINHKFVEVANEYQAKDIQFIAISSNDVEYFPEDGPEMMTHVAQSLNYSFPYLYDETQTVAKAYQAECTPDFFVFDDNLKLAYRGRFDESRPNMGSASGRDLTNALDAMLNNKDIAKVQYPSIGCSIKWK